MGWGDVNNLMAHSAGDIYITISRTSNNITDTHGNALQLPYALFGINDFQNNYATLMQSQLYNLNLAGNS